MTGGRQENMIYLDNAATTRTLPEAVSAMLPFFTEEYGNASAVYALGQDSRGVLGGCREKAAALIGARPDEIFFTSGGSESDSWALTGMAELSMQPGGRDGYGSFRLITSAIEHPAVLRTAEWLQDRGAEVHFLPVDEKGTVSLEALGRILEEGEEDRLTLVSVMTANNEIGTIEPVREAARMAHEHGAFFHTDAVQAFGQIPVSVREEGIDLLSASSHKLYGPKGAGLLYVRRGILLPPLIHGGEQERGRRAGTENIPGIVGFAKACEAAAAQMDGRMRRETMLRDRLLERVLPEVPGTSLNGPEPGKMRLPGNANLCFEGIEAETLLALLDIEGVCASAGSACSAGSLEPSHVLMAIGLDEGRAKSSLRFSIGAFNTMEEIDRTAEILKQSVRRVRRS